MRRMKKMAWAAVLSLTLAGAALAQDSRGAQRRDDGDSARVQSTWQNQNSDRDARNRQPQTDRDGDRRGADRNHQRGVWNSPYANGNGARDNGAYTVGRYGNVYNGAYGRNTRDRDGDRDDAPYSNRNGGQHRRSHVDRERR